MVGVARLIDFWVLITFRIINWCRLVQGTCYLHLQGEWVRFGTQWSD